MKKTRATAVSTGPQAVRALGLALALVVSVLGFPSAAQAAPGVADTQKCVTWHEYFAFSESKGMPRAEVERLLDWEGRSNAPRYDVNAGGHFGAETWKHRVYRGCKGQHGVRGTWANSYVHVYYNDDNRLRFAYWFVACLTDCVSEIEG